jgi:hypothetical protein
MEPAWSIAQFWWWPVPLLAVLCLAPAAWKRIRSRSHRVALASVAPGNPGISAARAGAVLGYIDSVLLGLALLMAAMYFYAWITGQFPFNESEPPP